MEQIGFKWHVASVAKTLTTHASERRWNTSGRHRQTRKRQSCRSSDCHPSHSAPLGSIHRSEDCLRHFERRRCVAIWLATFSGPSDDAMDAQASIAPCDDSGLGEQDEHTYRVKLTRRQRDPVRKIKLKSFWLTMHISLLSRSLLDLTSSCIDGRHVTL